jgi:metallo-beta-lactamase family protein
MNKSPFSIQFLGAAKTVTGSKFFLRLGSLGLLVDCGIFQGYREIKKRNEDPLGILVSDIDYVLLTHGHLDHAGYLPKLVKDGFKGKILGTAPTLDLAEIILMDSGKIQEEEALRSNRFHPDGEQEEALYNVDDARHAIQQFSSIEEGEWVKISPDVSIRLQYIGHILGATSIEIDFQGKRMVFSGDIGRENDILLHPFKKPEKADILLLESTYGNRKHPQESGKEALKHVVLENTKKQGTLILPCFAVERAQTLMFLLWQLMKEKQIPPIKMILDSPMAANVLDLFKNHPKWHEIAQKDLQDMISHFTIIKKFKESLHMVESDEPKIILAGSGMLSGGRVLRYLQKYIGDPDATVGITGFQAIGTKGRRLVEGAQTLRIYGRDYPVKAKIVNFEMFSAHADQDDIMDWISEIKIQPAFTFLIHGEEESMLGFQAFLKEKKNWESHIPEHHEIVDLS